MVCQRIRMQQAVLPSLFSILWIFIFSSCAHRGDWAKRVDWKEIDFENIPGQDEYPDAGAIVLLDEGEMEIFDNSQTGLSVFEQHRVVKILNTSGHRYLNIAIPYGPQTKVDKIQVRTISPEGKITVLDDEKIFDITFYPNFVFYSDKRAKLFTIPAVDDGSLIEYRYRLNIGSLTFWHSWNFQDVVPTLLSRFTLIEPPEWDVHYRLYGIDLEPYVEESPAKFKNTYIWEIRDIPPLKSEFGMPPARETVARLALAPVGIGSWDDVAQWYYDLSEPQIKGGSGVKNLASTLTQGVTDDRERLRLIYEWIRDHIRYIAVSIGIGGYQPHPAEEILRNRYGDCKDMTTLLCSLTREVGIDAYEVLVSTWHHGIPDTTLPSQLQFNHAIAYCPTVGERGVWMDATAKGCPFDHLPWYDQGLPVLVVGDEGKALLPTTPRVPSDSNRTVIDWRVELDSSGTAVVEGKSLIWGAYASDLREELIHTSNHSQRQWLETWLASRCVGAVLDSFRIGGKDPVQDPLTLSYAFRTRTFAVCRSAGMTFRPGSVSAFDLPDYFRSESRVHPIRILYGLRNELNLSVHLPEGWTVEEPSLYESLESCFGSAEWSWSFDGDIFQSQSTVLLGGDDITPDQYQEFRRFLDGIRERDLRDVVIKKVVE